MGQKLGFAEVLLAKTPAGFHRISKDRLPVGIAMAAIAGINVALWTLIVIVFKSLF